MTLRLRPNTSTPSKLNRVVKGHGFETDLEGSGSLISTSVDWTILTRVTSISL